MTETIQAIFIDPAIAIARLGGGNVPQDAYAWVESANPRTDGETVVVPQWSLDVANDGAVQPRLPTVVQLRDGALIRPVAPFLEIWALVGETGSAASTWREEPLTPALLAKAGASEADIKLRIDAKNLKAARRTGNADLAFGTFPAVELSGDEHASVTLHGVSPPGVKTPMIPKGRSIPLGSVQILRSRPQPAPGTAPWVSEVNLEVLRFRFTPGRGRFYGPPQAGQPAGRRPPAVEPVNAFLNAAAGWFNGTVRPVIEPSDTYDAMTEASTRSLGVVDDTCEARIDITLSLPGRAKRVLTARANIFAGPPDFAPDRRPFLSLADELNDRTAGGAARNAAVSAADREAWVEDLFERIYETLSLLNVDLYRGDRGLRLSGPRLAPKPIPKDAVLSPTQAMGGRDALRNPDIPVAAPGKDEPLPLAQHARTRHRALADIDALRAFVSQHRGRLETLIRRPFEVEQGEDADNTTMRMPPFMRQSNALPLTLSAWQYDLLMSWVRAIEATPEAKRAVAAPRPPRRMSDAAIARRAAVLARLNRSGGRPR